MEYAAAHQLLDHIQSELTKGNPRTKIYYLLERGRVYNSAGEKKPARFLARGWPAFCSARLAGHRPICCWTALSSCQKTCNRRLRGRRWGLCQNETQRSAGKRHECHDSIHLPTLSKTDDVALRYGWPAVEMPRVRTGGDVHSGILADVSDKSGSSDSAGFGTASGSFPTRCPVTTDTSEPACFSADQYQYVQKQEEALR